MLRSEIQKLISLLKRFKKLFSKIDCSKRLTSKKFKSVLENFKMDFPSFVDRVVKLSINVKYNSKQVTSVKLLYYNREEIVNK